MCFSNPDLNPARQPNTDEWLKAHQQDQARQQQYYATTGNLPPDQGFPAGPPTTPGMSPEGSDVTGTAWQARGYENRGVPPMYADQNDRARERAFAASPLVNQLAEIFRASISKGIR